MKTVIPSGKYHLWEDNSDMENPKIVATEPFREWLNMSNPDIIIEVFNTVADLQNNTITVLENSTYNVRRGNLISIPVVN